MHTSIEIQEEERPPSPPSLPPPLPQASRLLRVLLLAAALPRAAAQHCPPGAIQAACAKVLVVGAEYAPGLADVQQTLQGMNAFATVDTFDARSVSDGGIGTPSAAQLAEYDAVLTFSVWDYADAGLMGDRLAAYHDQGGGVVVATAANAGAHPARLQGAYGAVGNGYALLDYASGGYTENPDSMGAVLEPQSPLMAGVASFAAQQARQGTASVVAGRGVVVARWAGGGQEPLVLRGTRGNRTLVELNFWPLSSSVLSWAWTGDGGLLMRNGLKYSRCMPCGMGTYAGAGGGGGVSL